ncbi:hypothetical protein PFICI_06375 [Pestalotiopsis fici W106-1]|uniref:Uncharacterized protein n=1 Tax=Pestalotiopsis fici (strain W106-1 / CGMCC3.15140) TaxID=1229662 RepID=W3X5H8_PESFW|nr:uncharacterized protein PFICI_06375 [Pestalotiopsis fici W106-1]ETS81373.1 hypothetical protein PFICI_06375 [Pestalotiopsis fici W106-1]
MSPADTYASPPESLIDTGFADNRTSLHLPVDLRRHSRGRSRSVTSFGPEHYPEETQVTLDSLPDYEFQRRATGRWYGYGKVFEISGQHEDKTIANRCMVVVGRARDLPAPTAEQRRKGVEAAAMSNTHD